MFVKKCSTSTSELSNGRNFVPLLSRTTMSAIGTKRTSACALHMCACNPKQTLVLWRTGKDTTYSAGWVCNIADITRDEVYVDVHT